MQHNADRHDLGRSGATPRIRQFGVFDELVLIAALAGAFVVTGAFISNELRGFLIGRPQQSWVLEALDWIPVLFFGLIPRYVCLLMVALLIMRLRRPRPHWRSISRQPGAVACAAGTTAILPGSLILLSRDLFGEVAVPSPALEPGDWKVLESSVPLAVLAAWVALALSGRWRSERSWIDRTGRVLGFYWVILWVLHWYFMLQGVHG